MSDSTSALSNVQGAFNGITASAYWHYLAKTDFKEDTYKRWETIGKISGLNNISTYGYTPLHVAAITKNKHAIKFLLKQQVSTDTLDDAKHTAKDYCYELWHLFNEATQPALPPQELEPPQRLEKKTSKTSRFDVANSDLKTWLVDLSKAPFKYQAATHDFGMKIKHLLYIKPNDESVTYENEEGKKLRDAGLKIEHLAQNLAKVAEKEGFKLSHTKYKYAVRDNWLRCENGSFFLLSASEYIPIAIEKANSRSAIFGTTAALSTNHSSFSGSCGASLDNSKKATADFSARFCIQQPLCTRFFFEGGHHFVLSDAKGIKHSLVGEDLFYTILNQFELEGVFEDKDISLSQSTEIAKKLTSAEIETAICEMHAQGWAPMPAPGKGFIEAWEIQKTYLPYFRSSSSSYTEYLIKNGYYQPLELNQQQVEDSRQIASVYIAKKLITKRIIAATLGVEPFNLHLIQDTGSHLDVSLKPGPKGSLLQQNYECTLSLLQHIKEKADQYQLSKTDLEQLERYIGATEVLRRSLHSMTKTSKEKLEKAGFRVIPLPGIFFDINPTDLNPHTPESIKTYNINFMNAITGYSEKNQRFFYIANGASVGNRLGQVLMDAFSGFIQHYVPNIKMHYIGYDPQKPTDFKEAMAWWNVGTSQAGPHSLSQELETETYEG